MKKIVLGAAALLALGLGVLCACTDPTPDPGPGPDPGPEPDPGPSTDFSEQLEDFAMQKWYSVEGVLDFADGSFTGAESFSIDNVTGTENDTLISVTADGVAYELQLNIDGALEMRNAETDAVETTFMAEASAYSGAWTEDGNTTYYVLVSPDLDEEGYFGFQMVAQGSLPTDDILQAVTVFSYEQGSPSMFFYVPEEDISIYYTGSTVYMSQGSDMSGTAIVPFTGVFSAAYLNAGMELLTIDFLANTVNYRETDVACQAGYGLFGAGIWFQYEEQYYALVYDFDSTRLFSDNGSEVYAPYTSDWLAGSEAGENSWINASNIYEVSFASEESVTFMGEEYPIELAVSEGDVVYTFMMGTEVYVIRPVGGNPDVFQLESDDRYEGYYFRKTAAETFVGSFTSNSETLTIDESYFITIRTLGESDDASTQGLFAYLPELGAIALSFQPFGTGGATLYLTEVNENGIYWTLAGGNGSYAVYMAYFTEEFLPEAEEIFTESLSEDVEDDYFTMGGKVPVELRFDFENGTAELTGYDTFYFTWGYGYMTNTTAPDLYVELSNDPGLTTGTYEYDRILLIPTSTGLQATFSVMRVDAAAATVTTVSEEDAFFIPNSTFEELKGISFVYNGAFVDQTIAIDEDGTLTISTYDISADGTQLMPATAYDYALALTVDEAGTETLTIRYTLDDETEGTIVVTDRLYAVLDSVVYSHPDLAAAAGTYYDASYANYLTLSAQGGLRYNGSVVTVNGISSSDGAVTIEYTRTGTQFTAVFSEGTATVGSDTYGKVTFSPEKFVGTYEVGGADIVVTLASGDVNDAYALVARINGTVATASWTCSSDGKPQYTFHVTDFATFRPITCTMTLDGDTLTVAVGESSESTAAASWSYGDFAFEGEKTVGDETLTCIVKEGAPVFLLGGEQCTGYVVSIEDGEATLRLTCGDTTIVLAEGGEIL